MRVVLATGLFAIGVELPKSYLAKHIKSLLIMVIPTMAIGWVISAGLLPYFRSLLSTFNGFRIGIMKVLFPNLNFISTLVISACLTPTDPILASAIIGGKFAVKNVPKHIRHLLSAEAAANDGLAYPFLSISIYLTVESSRSLAVENGFLIGWFCKLCGPNSIFIANRRPISSQIKSCLGLSSGYSLVCEDFSVSSV